jgi:hypothetical protein
MTFSVGSVRGARLGFHGAESDAAAIMPLFRPEQDKNLRLPWAQKGALARDRRRFSRRAKILD